MTSTSYFCQLAFSLTFALLTQISKLIAVAYHFSTHFRHDIKSVWSVRALTIITGCRTPVGAVGSFFHAKSRPVLAEEDLMDAPPYLDPVLAYGHRMNTPPSLLQWTKRICGAAQPRDRLSTATQKSSTQRGGSHGSQRP